MATRRRKTTRKKTTHRKTRKKGGSGSVKTQLGNVIKSLQTIKKHV